jgi:pSer/pThr/pTyr-binding forkhead associated (FHA) protein
VPPGGDYMILESLKSAPAKVIHIFDLAQCDGSLLPLKCPDTGSLIYPQKNEFKIGRSVESDMKIADISVSRVHSFIRFEGNELIIEDNGSKFGTMVRVNKPEKLVDTKFFK